jgi:hypothetical protein
MESLDEKALSLPKNQSVPENLTTMEKVIGFFRMTTITYQNSHNLTDIGIFQIFQPSLEFWILSLEHTRAK